MSDDDALFQEFMALLGKIVVTWGRIERSLDIAIDATKPFRIEEKPDRRHVFQAKLKVLRDTCSENPELRDVNAHIIHTLEKLEEMIETRHTLVHGYCHGIARSDNPTIHFRRARYGTKISVSPEIRATKEYLSSYLTSLKNIDARFAPTVVFICNATRKARHRAGQ